MAYVNVKEWSPDQVTEWLKGLDNVIFPYINSFLNNEVKGHQLLNLRSDDLEHLGVFTLGHQELILEAVEHLRNFHYELDRENLQLLALRLSCAAHSLYNELLSAEDTSKVETQTMSDVANIITTIKPLVCWLDRNPFSGQGEYTDRKTKLLQLSLEMATCTQRDRFAEQPVEKIQSRCQALAELADNIIQEISDPMLLQPASLDLATLKKKENDLGFSLMPSYHGVHQIAEIKFASPAHASSKLEEGDEIVQVNYQTVVGWQRKKVLGLFQESPPDIVLTLKKRPRHTKVYGQIYMKPYRLPSKKRAIPYSRWNDNLPSPRPELLTIPDFEMPPPRLPQASQPQHLEMESSSDSEPPDSPLESQVRVYPLKPRPVLQRRNTITGASPTSKRPHQAIEQYWNELKHQAAYKHSSSTYIETDNYNRDSVYLRDKSASCGHGLELTQRPATYPKKFDKTLLINDSNENRHDGKKRVNFEDHKVGYEEKIQEHKTVIKNETKSTDKKKLNDLSSIKEVSNSTNEIDKSVLMKESNFTNNFVNFNSCDSSEQNLEKSISVNSLASLSQSDGPIKFIDETVDEMYDRSHMNSEWKNEIIEELIGTLKKSCLNITGGVGNNTTPTNSPEKNITGKSLEVLQINSTKTENVEEQNINRPIALPRSQMNEIKVTKKPPEIPIKPDILKKPAVPPRSFTTKITRGRLDKSHSTPAYDTTQESDKVILDTCRTPEILITAPETNDANVSNIENVPESNFETTKKNDSVEKENIPKETENKANLQNTETTPVVETINTALVDIRSGYSEGKLQEKVDHLHQSKDFPEKQKTLVKYDTSKQEKVEEKNRRLSDIEAPRIEPKYSIKVSDMPPEPPPRTAFNYVTETPGKMKHFETKPVSVSITKTPIMDFSSIDSNKNIPEVSKSNSETKISPTNSVVRAMMSKNKGGKKKNTLLAKRRKVSVKDLTPCDIQGYLYQRFRNKHTQNFHWEKRWFVLLGSCLYGFKSKDSLKAECLIFLTGFTVAIAHEVKSRSNAFKVYHTGTAFYFSAENLEIMTSWVELITAATLHSDGTKLSDNTLFSETDDSDSEKPKTDGKEKIETSKKFGSLKKFTSKKSNENTPHNESTSLDRKYLRFFNNSGSKTPKNQLPVPTPQFRSYRKVVPPNLVVNQNIQSTNNFTSGVKQSSKSEVTKSTECQNFSGSNLNLEVQVKREPLPTSSVSKPTKLKPKPINYIHASNPSLCDINDYRLQSFYHKTRQFTQRSENFVGFVTLEQFMLNQQEEERKQNLLFGRNDDVLINPNTIQPDVVYGEVRMPYSQSGDSRTFDNHMKSKKESELKFDQKKHVEGGESRKLSHSRNNSDGYTDLYYDKHKKQSSDESYIQSKTLPKTEKLCDNQSKSLSRSPEARDENACYEDKTELVSDLKMSEPYELQYADKKSLRMQKLTTESFSSFRERSYEMIYCPQKVNDVHFAQNRMLDAQKKYVDVQKKTSKLTRQHSLNSADKKETKIFNRGESPEKFWLDSLRRSDKISDKNNSKMKLKPATQYTPMCLPLTPDQKGKLNPKFAFELNLDEKSNKSGKFKSFFGKQSDEKKEKTLLGSPRLHRALFRKHNNQETDWSSEVPQVVPLSTNVTSQNPRTGLSNSPSGSVVMSPPPDYPGLEYPPVFEPETYSLANPSCSLTLLRKQQK